MKCLCKTFERGKPQFFTILLIGIFVFLRVTLRHCKEKRISLIVYQGTGQGARSYLKFENSLIASLIVFLRQ